MTFTYPGCSSSSNVLCKHPRAVRTYYADLSFLPDGVTVISAAGDTEDASIIVESVTVLEDDLDEAGCAGASLLADRALLVVLSGGVESDDEVLITLNWVQSDGDEDSKDVRLIVAGTT